jgi:hypothetical protein
MALAISPLLRIHGLWKQAFADPGFAKAGFFPIPDFTAWRFYYFCDSRFAQTGFCHFGISGTGFFSNSWFYGFRGFAVSADSRS